MISCKHASLKKHGRDGRGKQRWKCRTCGATITKDDYRRPYGDMRLDIDRADLAAQLLRDGHSRRAVARLLGITRDTACRLANIMDENEQTQEASVIIIRDGAAWQIWSNGAINRYYPGKYNPHFGAQVNPEQLDVQSLTPIAESA